MKALASAKSERACYTPGAVVIDAERPDLREELAPVSIYIITSTVTMIRQVPASTNNDDLP